MSDNGPKAQFEAMRRELDQLRTWVRQINDLATSTAERVAVLRARAAMWGALAASTVVVASRWVPNPFG